MFRSTRREFVRRYGFSIATLVAVLLGSCAVTPSGIRAGAEGVPVPETGDLSVTPAESTPPVELPAGDPTEPDAPISPDPASASEHPPAAIARVADGDEYDSDAGLLGVAGARRDAADRAPASDGHDSTVLPEDDGSAGSPSLPTLAPPPAPVLPAAAIDHLTPGSDPERRLPSIAALDEPRLGLIDAAAATRSADRGPTDQEVADPPGTGLSDASIGAEPLLRDPSLTPQAPPVAPEEAPDAQHGDPSLPQAALSFTRRVSPAEAPGDAPDLAAPASPRSSIAAGVQAAVPTSPMASQVGTAPFPAPETYSPTAADLPAPPRVGVAAGAAGLGRDDPGVGVLPDGAPSGIAYDRPAPTLSGDRPSGDGDGGGADDPPTSGDSGDSTAATGDGGPTGFSAGPTLPDLTLLLDDGGSPPPDDSASAEGGPDDDSVINAVQGSAFDVVLEGTGWVYLGSDDETLQFLSRRVLAGQERFSFVATAPGSFELRFRRRRTLDGRIETASRTAEVSSQGTAARDATNVAVPEGGASTGATAPAPPEPPAGGSSPTTVASERPEPPVATPATSATPPSSDPEAGTPQSGLESASAEGVAVSGGTEEGTADSGEPEDATAAGTVAGQGGDLGQQVAGGSAGGSDIVEPGGSGPESLGFVSPDTIAALEAAGDTAQTISFLEAIRDGRAASSIDPAEVLIRLARSYAEPGPTRDIDAAAARYRELLEQFPLSNWWSDAQAELQRLERRYLRTR